MSSMSLSKHARKYEARPPRVSKEFRLHSVDFGFICAGVSNAGGYKKKRDMIRVAHHSSGAVRVEVAVLGYPS